MILLDTDHVTVLKYVASDRSVRLKNRLAAISPSDIGVTIVTVEESMRGWMAFIARERAPRRQVSAYRELADLFRFFSAFTIALFDDAAVVRLETLGSIHISKMDKKIASIALATGSLLLTANTSDFKQVPGCPSITGWTERIIDCIVISPAPGKTTPS
jgi:tRNA(fMet)-specific endonuclease VapC